MPRTRLVTPRRVFLLAAAGALLAVLLLPRDAAAGSYVVTQCSQHAPAPGQASWERSSAHYAERTRCGGGEGLQIHHDAERTALNRYGAWVWRAPAGTVFTSMQANASLTNSAGHYAELWAKPASGGSTSWGAEHGEFRVHRLAGEYVQFAAMLRCAAPGPDGQCGRAEDDAAHAYVRGVFATVADRAAPTLSITGGTLLDDAVVRGARSLAFAASDRGGGIRAVSVQANGTQLAADVRNCALSDGFATALSPCPASSSELSTVDTRATAFRLGPDNVVTACAADLALDAMANRDCEARRLWVDNACPGSAAAAKALVAGFGSAGEAGRARARVEVRSDRRASVAGRLIGASGAPVGGARVCVLTRDRVPGSPVLVAAVVATRPNGTFSAELPAGPSREVFVHQAFGNEVVARHGLALESRVRPTLRIRPRHPRNGQRLRFSGSIPGPACGGRVVKLQARVSRKRWQVFRTARAGANCGFRARYRLRRTAEDTRYRFRAYVPPQAGYPYLPGYSRENGMRVSGGRG